MRNKIFLEHSWLGQIRGEIRLVRWFGKFKTFVQVQGSLVFKIIRLTKSEARASTGVRHTYGMANEERSGNDGVSQTRGA